MDQKQLYDFDGKTYEPTHDRIRLNHQLALVYEVMTHKKEWLTLQELSKLTGGEPEASVSARLRDLRKERFGGYTVLRRRRGNEKRGVFEYKLVFNQEKEVEK